MKKNNGVLTGVTIDDMDLLKKNPSEFWKGVKEIGTGAFSVARMSQFPTKFSIPEGVKKIGKNAFAGQLVSEVEIADSVEEIDDDAFKTCINLTTFKVSKNSKLKRIGSHAFQFAGLTSFDMPDSVTEVADGAFAYCLHMENMHLSSSLKTLGSSAMVGCTLLPKEKIDASDEVKSTFLGIPTAKQPETDAKKQQPVADKKEDKKTQQPEADAKKQQPKAEVKDADAATTQNKADKKADAKQSKEEKKATQPKTSTTTQNKSDKKAQQPATDSKKTETPTTTQENKSEEKNDSASKATMVGKSKYSAEIDALFNKLASQKITEDQLKTALESKLQELSETATVEELKQFRGTVALAEEAFVSALKLFDYDAEKLAAYTDAKDAISGMTFGKK